MKSVGGSAAYLRGAAFSAALAFAIPASAQTVAHGRELYFGADFEGAKQAFTLALESNDLDVDEAALSHIYLATLCALEGDHEAAGRHAAAAAALDPEIEPPEGAPSEVASMVSTARASSGGEPAELRITAPEALRPGRPGQVRARLVPAPAELGAAIELSCLVAGRPQRQTGAFPEVVLNLWPEGEEVRCSASVRTQGGATLITADATLRVSSDTERQVDDSLNENRARASKKMWTWIAIGGGAAAAVATTVVVVLLVSGGGSDQVNIHRVDVPGFEGQ